MSLQVIKEPVPITILTGFLGAGKTTLLNRILGAEHGLRVAVLVNDFGAINIDSRLVVGIEGESVTLSNGCICCTIRDDLLKAVLRLLRQPELPDYIIIEASGVSDPLAVAVTFQLPELRQLVLLDGIITVVDAENASDKRFNYDLVQAQIAAADIVVLNKIDLVSVTRREKLHKWVHGIVPQARILDAVRAEVPLELVLGIGRDVGTTPEPAPAAETHEHEHEHDHDHDHEHDHDHSTEFSTWSFTNDRPFELKKLQRVLRMLPGTIFRAKGVVTLHEMPERRVVVHVVGRRISMLGADPWGAEQPSSELVFIGSPGGLDSDVLDGLLRAALAVGEVAGTPNRLALAGEWLRKNWR